VPHSFLTNGINEGFGRAAELEEWELPALLRRHADFDNEDREILLSLMKV
jgi:hypothetical protein